MALGYAKAQLLGNLTRDIEVRTTPGGKTVGSFTLAVNKTKDTVAYMDCVAWEKTCELIQNYTKKGDRLFVEVDVDQQTWEKDGQKRSKIEFVVRDFRLIQGKEDRQETQRPQRQEPDDIAEEIDLSSIPF